MGSLGIGGQQNVNKEVNGNDNTGQKQIPSQQEKQKIRQLRLENQKKLRQQNRVNAIMQQQRNKSEENKKQANMHPENQIPQIQQKLIENQCKNQDKPPQNQQQNKETSQNTPTKQPKIQKKSPSEYTPLEHRHNIITKIFKLKEIDISLQSIDQSLLYHLESLDEYIMDKLQILQIQSKFSRPQYLFYCYQRLFAMKKIDNFISNDQKMQILRMICLYFKNIFLQFQLFSLNNPVIKLEKVEEKDIINNLDPQIQNVIQILGLPNLSNKNVIHFEVRQHLQDLYQTMLKCPQQFLRVDGFFTKVIDFTLIDGSKQDIEKILLPIFDRFQFELIDIQQKNIINTSKIYKHLETFLSLLKSHKLIPQMFVESQAFLKYETVANESYPTFKKQKNLLALPLRLSSLPHEQIETMKTICQDVIRAKNHNIIIDKVSLQLNSVIQIQAKIFEFLLEYSEKTKINALKWIRGIANYNLDKLKTYNNNSNLSSDGVIINSLSVVLQLFKLTRQKHKSEQIIYEYFYEFSNQRINLKNPQIINIQKRKEILQRKQMEYLEYSDEESKELIAKKNSRYCISQVLSYLLGKNYNKQSYQKQYIQMCDQDYQAFQKFTIFIINDLEYLADQIIEKLKKIRQLEQQAVPSFIPNQIMHQIQQFESRVQNQNFAFNSIFKLLEITVQLNPKLYIRDQILQKFANFLNYILKIFATKKGLEIKVIKYFYSYSTPQIKNMDKVKFKPIKIFSRLMNIYMPMLEFYQFKKAMVLDDRSYSSDLIDNVINKVFQRKIIPKFMIYEPLKELFKEVLQLQEEVKAQQVKTFDYEDMFQDNYEDAPDEFRDAIMLTIMENPVLLPSSEAVVDYKTIKKLIINSEQDPFNRSKLTLDMVKQLPQLKERIIQYKQSKRNSLRK